MTKHYGRINFILIVFAVLLVTGILGLAAAQEVTPEPNPAAAFFPPTPTPQPAPAPYNSVTQDGISVSFFFPNIVQGSAGLVQVLGEGIAGISGQFIDHTIPFFSAPPAPGYFGLLAVGIAQTANIAYPLTLTVTFADGRSAALAVEVEVVVGQFITQEVIVQPDRAYLATNEMEGAEQGRLQEIFAQSIPDRLWDTVGIDYPMQGELTSPFGAVRTFNTGLAARHTGWDFNAAVGTPLVASGAGRVAFASALDIRGNYVLIDHGGGVFTGYAHLSQIHVTVGQDVMRGQIIGMSGNTGRSSAAHFHWEAAVHGEWVDPVLLAELWLP